MLRCPKCNRTYQDDMQKFCTHDGGRLVPDLEQAKPYDPNATVHANLSDLDMPVTPPPARPPDLSATIAGAPPQATQPQPAPPPSTANFRAPETGPTNFPQTTRLTQQPPQPQPQPPQQQNYPPPAQSPAPPAQQQQQMPPPNRSEQFPTMLGQPPAPSAGLPSASAPLPGSSAALPSGSSAQLPGQSAPLPSQAASAPLPVAKKKSKLGLMLAITGVILLLIIAAGGVGGYFYSKRLKTAAQNNSNNGSVAVNPTLNSNDSNTNTNTNSSNTNNEPALKAKPKVEAPPNSVKFENAQSNLDGKLAEHYVDFYFYYPQSWQKSAKAGVSGAANFVEVERKLPPDQTQENLTVSWYESKGTVEADLAGVLPALIKKSDANLAQNLSQYEKVSEGKTTINGIEGYEFRFKAVSYQGDSKIWGRIVFLPPGDEQSNKGVTLYMLTTSLAPELQSVNDVGIKGELPIILNSFTLGKS